MPVELGAAASPYAAFASAAYLDDPKGAFDIDDVSRGSARSDFVPFPRARLGDRVIKGWFRFALRAPAHEAATWTLDAANSCDVFDVYVPRANGTYGVIHAGMLVPYAERGRETPYPSLPLSPEMTGGEPLYVYVSSNRAFTFGERGLFIVVPTLAFDRGYQDFYIRDIFFCGLFFAILVINLFLGFYLRDRAFFAYVIAMFLHVLTQITQSSTGWRVFWPHLSLPFTAPSVIVEGLFFVSLAVFWRIFLNLPQRRPILDRILLGFAGLALLRMILQLVLPPAGWLSMSDFPMVDCLALTALVAAIDAARHGYRAARFLIVALAGLLLIWNTTFLIQLHIIPAIFHITTGVYYGVAWDALFLTFALADRIETAKRGMMEAQQQALAAQTETVDRLRERDVAVSRFLPRAFLEFLGRANVVDLQLGDHVESEMTILFSDIRSFTALSETMSPEQTFEFLNSYLRRAGPVIRGHEGFIDKYIGDALLGLFPKAAHTAIDAAIDLQRGVNEYNRERARAGHTPIAIGVGLHRGMLMLGAIGESERIETTVIAEAVNIAARTENLTKQFHAPVIATAAVIAGLERPQDYKLRPLGEVIVYGASRGVNMFEVFDGDDTDLLLSKVRTLDDFTAGVRAFTAGDFMMSRAAFARVLEASPNDRTAAYFLEQSRLFAAAVPAATWDGRIRMDVK